MPLGLAGRGRQGFLVKGRCRDMDLNQNATERDYEGLVEESIVEELSVEQALTLALEIIRRQDALLRKHGIDPREDPAA